ncbi:Gfo/Idh/MocA family protein [Saccharolobus solfataricus]|uniref:Dehydrogenase, putative n=3 Tax=Saccharolobus solfataricus TaxID=2287 RepID=Q97UJ8_SACS2|nr:Gfo/Idh/MocA family oxidoreductase [Saccharolobus solfataricus]AET42937.1 dehydrogenase-like protein [Saccharolobus solfataricus 98/2]AAK43115.1 Dehydrogenase, putative [Saccharolobus solfataricus P2]AKA73164.1 gfo/Idh/MocA family oxidoreductase [Saccharolobus solfataricus]AKA75862.1 gfo/Idh/MocA family oxidoreductase [Saccharolobus solfataricus]AKA78554.1 gfo/Idh/MocA family oxidoreductase [Saccharolobus solfataricus]
MKIAVVGCDGFGKVHLRAMRNISGIEYYVFSRNEEKARECMKEFNAEGYFTRYEDVIKSNVDIVDLLVSHDQHYPMGVMAMKAGKHLMLEKPIARTIEEAMGLINTSKDTKRKFMVLEQFYFESSVRKAKELLPRLGNLSLIIVRSIHLYQPKGWRREKEKMGGGALIDGGVHFIDTLLNLGGEYESVRGVCGKYFSGIEGEDLTLATLRFRKGHLGLLMYSWTTPNPPKVPAFEIYGENGSIIEDPNTRVMGKAYGDLILNVDGKEERIEVEKVNPIEEEIRGFVKAVKNNTEVPMPPEIALRDLKAVLDIYKSCGYS